MVQRQKPFGTLASRTIGDIYGEIEAGGVTKGKNGLELQYDSLLRGEPGVSSVRRVGGGWTNVVEIEPVDGMDIRTTIDINIQGYNREVIGRYVEEDRRRIRNSRCHGSGDRRGESDHQYGPYP